MLQLFGLNHNKLHGLTNYKDLKRERNTDGDEVLSFSYPQNDDKYQDIKEETYIRTKDNEYVIKEVNVKDDWTEFVCKVNAESLKGTPFSHFESIENNCTYAVNLALAGTGWTIGLCDVTKLRTVKKSNCSSYDILQEIRKVYRCDFRFDAINKKVYIYQSMGSDKGSYFTDELNLKKLDVQSNSYDYCTRIIPIGKDGLRINDVNSGKEYVENYQYSSKIITIYWDDNRYTAAQSLKDDAEAKLDELSKPVKAYSADVYDLARLNDKYKNILDYDLGDTITLLSKDKKVKDKQRIVKIIEYLDEPERNSCEIANRTLSLEDMQSDTLEAAETVSTITTSDGKIDGTKVDSIDGTQIKNLKVMVADIQDANIITARIGILEATVVYATDFNAYKATIDNALINKANVIDLTASNGRITTLESKAANIDNILAGNLSAANMQANFITATSGLIANAAISDAMIANLNANKINAGKINTNLVTIQSNSGNMLISDNTIQIKDASRVRVQIGKDASNDYNMYVWDSSGNLMFDATGLKANGIKDKIIRDDMVSDTANISGTKIEKESLVSQINGATTLLKATKIKLDTENQTLDVAFTSLKSTVTNQGTTITNQGTSISTIQGQISTKIWTSDITTAISNIQIGVRNLYKMGTVGRYAGGVNNPITANIVVSGYRISAIANPSDLIGNTITNLQGTTLTISGKTNSSSLRCYYKFDNDVQNSTNPTVTNGKFSFQLTIPSGATSLNIGLGQYPYSSTYYIEYVKVENGNKQTDWIQATEDTDTQITTISNNYSSLDQTVDSISANVGTLQTTTSDLGTRMTSAEGNITTLSNSITLKVSTTDFTTYQATVTNNFNTTNGNVTTAQNTANSKRRVFTSQPTTPYDIGDLWSQGTTGDLMKCKVARSTGSYTATDWEKASKYTDDTTANGVQTNLNTTNTRVTTAEGNITTLQNQITLKVTQSEVDTSINNSRTMVKLNGLELLNLEYKTNVNATNKPFAAGTYSIVAATEIGGNANEPNLIKVVNAQFLYTPYIASNPNGTQYFKISIYNLDTNIGTVYVQCCYYDKDKVQITTNEGALTLINNVSNTAANAWNTFEGFIDPIASTDIRQKAVFMRIRILPRYSGQTGTTYLKDLSWRQLTQQTNETRIINTESSISILQGQIVSKVDSNGVKSIISQSATEVQTAFNGATGVFTIKNGNLVIQNASSVKVMWVDTNGLLTTNKLHVYGDSNNVLIDGTGNKGVDLTSTNGGDCYIQFNTSSGFARIQATATAPNALVMRGSGGIQVEGGIYTQEYVKAHGINGQNGQPLELNRLGGNGQTIVCDGTGSGAGGGLNCGSFYASSNATIAGTIYVGSIKYNDGTYALWSQNIIRLYNVSASNYMAIYDTNGTTYGASIWVSDRTLKTNIVDSVKSALDDVMKIQHRQFTWKDSGQHCDIGYISQELMCIDQSLVFGVPQENGSILYHPKIDVIVPMLSKAIHELKKEKDAEIENLKEQINNLKNLLVNV